MEVYLFNPDNDLALSNGDANYMAPASARKMADDLALLPLWYASDNAFILNNCDVEDTWIKEINDNFGLTVRLLREGDIKTHSSLKLCPWGWNTTLIRLATLWGFLDECLPNKRQMNEIRELSHRSVAVALLRELNTSSAYCGESFLLTTDEEVRSFVERYPRVLLKAPWSGSGKGLRPGKGEYTFPIQQWAHRVIKNQRCVIGEPYYNKVEDFAMEFFCDESGEIRFAGYSLFETDGRGAYKGNILATDEMIEARLAQYIDCADLHALRTQLIEKLSTVLTGKYAGYLGVDMMICSMNDAPIYRIHPCVEVNLRRNMGLFARLLYDRYVVNSSTGSFSVDFFQEGAALLADHHQKQLSHPLRIENGRVVSGYLSLTPITSQTNYRASILVEG